MQIHKKFMHNITLICTRHGSLGSCNQATLYRIIENINPEVIFEELPSSEFDNFYTTIQKSNLESKTINEYKKKYSINQMLVDSNNIPPEDFFLDYEYLINTVDKHESNFGHLMDLEKNLLFDYGFTYLNSDKCSAINNEIYNTIEATLKVIQNERLNTIFNNWKNTNSERENYMLKCIYDYCETNNFSQAIFLIGSAHRQSIINKISDFQQSKPIKLNWQYLSF
jgi:hypothetical protein